MGNTVGRQFHISQLQKEIINGCLLGDGSLECRSKEGSARLRIHHGWKQKEFVFWKYKTLRNLVSCPPRKIISWKNPKNNEDYYSWYFHTRTNPKFKELYRMFYLDGRKVLPQNIFNLLTPTTLAVWIMDDGCNVGGSLILNTQNYSMPEHLILQKTLQEKFGILSTVNKDRDEFRLRLNRKNYSKLIKVVSSDIIIHSMRYKIVPVETESVRTR